MASPIDRMILSSVKCLKCGAGYGKCGCWEKCQRCGWTFEKGKKCDNTKCGGDGKLEIVAAR